MKYDPRDILVVGGTVFTSVGVGALSWPAGLVTAGVIMLGLGVLGAVSEARTNRAPRTAAPDENHQHGG